MTIGIGVLCEAGDCIILASDMRLSYGDRIPTKHDFSGKQWDLLEPFSGAAAVAGRLGICHNIISELTTRLGQLRAEPEIFSEHVENAIDDSRAHILGRFVKWALRRGLQITLHQLHTGKARNGQPLAPRVIERGCEIMERAGAEFEAQLIIAGFVGPPESRKLLFFRADRVEHVQCTTSPGFYVIGSGAKYALDRLAWRRQNADRRLQSSLLHVYEALRQARRDKAVGEPMDYVVIWRDGRVERINARHMLLKQWAGHYKRRNDTTSLDINPIAREQVLHMLQEHAPRC